jgi:hypothetical protein
VNTAVWLSLLLRARLGRPVTLVTPSPDSELSGMDRPWGAYAVPFDVFFDSAAFAAVMGSVGLRLAAAAPPGTRRDDIYLANRREHFPHEPPGDTLDALLAKWTGAPHIHLPNCQNVAFINESDARNADYVTVRRGLRWHPRFRAAAAAAVTGAYDAAHVRIENDWPNIYKCASCDYAMRQVLLARAFLAFLPAAPPPHATAAAGGSSSGGGGRRPLVLLYNNGRMSPVAAEVLRVGSAAAGYAPLVLSAAKAAFASTHERAVLDEVVAIGADRFIGYLESSFSWNVAQERADGGVSSETYVIRCDDVTQPSSACRALGVHFGEFPP